jgi:hypothetical protein
LHIDVDHSKERNIKMGFEVLNRRAARASGVAVNVSKNPKAPLGHGLSGFFRIGPDVVKEAGWTDPEKTPVRILAGNGDDTGIFILEPHRDGKTVPFKPKSGASLQLSFSAMSAGFSEPTGGTKEIEYQVEGNAIKVTVPQLRGGEAHQAKRTKITKK